MDHAAPVVEVVAYDPAWPARRYAAAKRQAAATYPGSRARYGNAKEPVMRELLAEAAAWAVAVGRRT